MKQIIAVVWALVHLFWAGVNRALAVMRHDMPITPPNNQLSFLQAWPEIMQGLMDYLAYVIIFVVVIIMAMMAALHFCFNRQR